MSNELEQFYINPSTPAQRQYEAVRAFVVDKLSAERIAKKFNYSIKTVYSFIRDAKAGKLNLFPVEKIPGPKARRTPISVQEAIIRYRKQNLSCKDIAKRVRREGDKISIRTVENILADAGFSRLPRRTGALRGMTNQKQQIPQRAQPLDFEQLESFSLDCPVAGVFFFLPYVLESGVLSIVKQCQLPESSAITAEQACLSMLLLKLIGNKRLSHMDAYDHEPGLGLFAGLSMLPKSSYMSSFLAAHQKHN